VPGKDYLVYFPGSGEVDLDISTMENGYQVAHLEMLTGQWTTLEVEDIDGTIRLRSPGQHNIFVIQKP
jgi:hypothetical protein